MKLNNFMKSFRTIAAFLGLMGVLLPLSMVANGATFSDIEGSRYEESIEFLYERGIVQGYSDGNFRPEQSVNRAELLKMIFAALNEGVSEQSNCFLDVKDEWFAPYICKAKELSIVEGYDDGNYKPDKEVNRVETFKILNESFGSTLRLVEEGEAWYAPYTEFMHVNGFASTYSYFPDGVVTREEAAYWIHQMILIEEGELDLRTVRDPGSEGCGENAPQTAPTQFLVDGEWREVITVVPDHYDPNHPYPLIVAFHGRTNSNAQVQDYYGLDEATAGEAFIVYPAGIKVNGSFTWADSGDSPDELRDYEFFDNIVAQFQDYYCIDQDQIFAVGHSLGAWFANSLACARGDVLRGVATLGGSRSESACTGPVAVMQWHNPNDDLAPYYTGLTARDYYLEQNQCSNETVVVEPNWAHCVEYLYCTDDAPTVWCPHTNDYTDYSGEYYPHTWPIDTGKEMWSFLSGL